ncbi:molybdopterin synthase [Saliphagus infecundisoli]|uniref:Molybdopterin synthase n=1 Tax=Saliphagus infecundisoli TaxID=1849069 RepID=A0ABD5QB41_9EURY|nr:molybdopterin synthase [Saliphagus infecundisoli]
MHVLGILDGGAGEETVERCLDRLVSELGGRGRVGVVRYDATIADGLHMPETGPAAGSDVTYELGADGDWLASGTGLSIDEALDSLAPDCAYAVVVGVPSLAEPAVVVGDADAEGETIAAVSGPGELDPAAVADAIERHEPRETLESLVREVKGSPRAERAGAIATFTGRVRAKDAPDDARTEALEFEKYDGVADRRLHAIREELEAREGVYEVRLHHRTGVVRDGEDIVFVVVLAGHREEAFATVEDGINRLKSEVPLFKKEITVDDEFWVHDRP